MLCIPSNFASEKNVGAITVNNHLHIYNWSEKHNEKDHLIETFEGKVPMKNVAHQKYLGITLSEDGCNVKILLRNKSAQTE